MAKNFIQSGRVLDYVNNGSAAIPSGGVVVIAGLLGVALADIAVGETGSVQVQGVFRVPKVAGAVIAQGETLTWDVSAAAFDDNAATAATGDITGPCAYAVSAAGNGTTTVDVMFTGVPGTVKAA